MHSTFSTLQIKNIEAVGLDAFVFTYAVPNFEQHKLDVLQSISTLGEHSVKSECQQISNTDWYLQGRVERPYINYLSMQIDNAIDLFREKIYFNLPYSGSRLAAKQYWFQQYGANDFHDWHIHNVPYAGVIFVELGSGAETQFLIGNEVYTAPVVEGQILIFPGIVPHRSPINITGLRKTSIAFNIEIL
jgi:hypothetical protein